jgi:hypothetical protein
MAEIDIEGIEIELPKGKPLDRARQLMKFSHGIVKLSQRIDFRMSSRGYAYFLQNMGKITKDEFDRAERLIGECVKNGWIPIDTLAKDEGREFSVVEVPTDCTPIEFQGRWLGYARQVEWIYIPDWFDGMRFYPQTLTEKIDIKNMLEPTSKKYHTPIGSAGGWDSILSRVEFGRRFREAEEKGLQPVLLYVGDYDPGGQWISDLLRKNLDDVKHVVWSDGARGYDPRNLIIERFALNLDQIQELKLPWIENLITGNKNRKMDLADPKHPHHNYPYVQNWLKTIGSRKVESTALVAYAEKTRQIYEKVLLSGYGSWEGLGADALDQFEAKRGRVVNEIRTFRRENGIDEIIEVALEKIRG